MTYLDDILKLTKRLISIKSDSKSIQQVSEAIQIIKIDLERAGLKPNVIEHKGVFSLFVSLRGNKNPRLLLNGHTDVVPGKSGQYQPVINGGRLIGRGAYDMKAACAVFVILMKDLNELKNKPDVGLLIVGDEELGGFNGSKYALTSGYKGKFVIAGEPSDLNIRLECKGVLGIQIITKGKSAHSSRVWDGENAVLKTLEGINRLMKLYPLPKEESWVTSINLSNIESELTVSNVVPDICKVFLDIRYIPIDDPEIIIKQIRSIFSDSKIKVVHKEPPMVNKKNNIYISEFYNYVKKLNVSTEYYNSHGSSDARFYTSEGIPAIAFGPMGADLHGDNEWVSIESLDEYYLLLFGYIKSAIY